MTFARARAGAVVLAMAVTGLAVPGARASTPTGTPASSPAHPVWDSNKSSELKPHPHELKGSRTKLHPRGKKHAHEIPIPQHHALPMIPVSETETWPLANAEARPPEELDAAVTLERHQRAEQAFQEAKALLGRGKQLEAIEQLDLAIELDPTWSPPVKLRADMFGELARRHRPSEAFLSAQAADVQRLLTLEPNVEVVARSQQLVALRAGSQDAQRKEARRRKMTKPALIVGSFSAALIIGGVFLSTGTYPSTDIDALGQRSYVYGGIAMAMVGVALAPAAISLGVLAGKQNRRDHAARELNAYTGRPQPTLALTPRMFRGGAGMGVQLQF
jgi:hypothetical protein